MREDAIRRGVTPPDERTVRERCLARGAEVPDLAVWKDFPVPGIYDARQDRGETLLPQDKLLDLEISLLCTPLRQLKVHNHVLHLRSRYRLYEDPSKNPCTDVQWLGSWGLCYVV